MLTPTSASRALVGLAAILFGPVTAWSATSVSCDAGCRPVTACAGNASPHLLCLVDRASDVKLTWRVDTKLEKDQSLHVYAGNPARAAGVPERAVTFTAEGDVQTGSFTFPSTELGVGPLLVITTLKSRKSETLLSWIPFRTSTEAETKQSLAGPPPTDNFSVNVSPAFAQVSAGWRELPATSDSRERTWFSLAPDPMLSSDVDLDGNVSGVPGVSIQVSKPWEARENWKTKAEEALGIPAEHAVSFETLHWDEKPARTIKDIPEVKEISLRNFYTVITLFTNASTANLSAGDLGLSGSTKYYAHETSATLKQVDHPLLWASYSQIDYSADRRLLGLLREHIQQNRPSLEIGPVQRMNGDGGPPVYRSAFTVRVRPWSDEETRGMQQPRAGVVGIDLLAVRVGMGGIKVPAANATGVQTDSLCNLWSCKETAAGGSELASIDLNKPPKGYEVSPPQASTLNSSGHIAMVDAVTRIAERSVTERAPGSSPVNNLPDFPSSAQFALAASLRAGALVRRGGWFGHRVDGILPINSYAQYVVRFTVATFPGQQMVTTDTAVIASPSEVDVVTVTPITKSLGDRIKEWIRDNLALSGIVLFAAFLALLLLIPGFRSFVSALFGLLAALIRKITPGGGGALKSGG